jgi:cell division protease FtsH
MSLGATYFSPEKNRVTYWRKELIDKLAVLMGGRIAEDIFLGDISSGAQMDISQATQLARSMVCQWGMSEALGQVAYEKREEEGSYYGGGSSEKSYSEHTAKEIDAAVKELVTEANKTAIRIITEHKDQVDLMAKMLLEFETLDQEDVKDIMNGKWNSDKKRAKLESAAKAHKRLPPPLPQIKPEASRPSIDITPQES